MTISVMSVSASNDLIGDPTHAEKQWAAGVY